MKIVIALAVLLAVASAQFTDEWVEWKKTHGKSYHCDKEELGRYTIWVGNKAYIEEHNKHQDTHGYTLAMNEFGDLESSEFVKLYNGYRQADKREGKPYVKSTADIPPSVDWRDKGYVTGIKNQGQCGSCWAFSTTGSLEGQHFKATGTLVSMSEQNLVDCSSSYGNHGCEGGLMDNGFKYIKDHGIDSEESYPYRAHDEKCRFNPSNVVANDTGFVDIKKDDEDELTNAVATVGPISVAMDASHSSFQFYHSGVYNPFFCSSTKLDHGVLAVGYGTDDNKDMYIVKNSWGTGWGMKGYFYIARGDRNKCGLATAASYPTV